MIQIIQEKIKDCEDSFFYEGEIACTEKPNGTKLSVSAEGEIRIRINDSVFKNNQVQEAIKKYDLTDKKLKELEYKGELEWLNNNWFEVYFLQKDSDTWDSVMCDVAYTYDEAITLLQSYIDDDKF